ncbi:hypothetical protein MRX96_018732 [Rhipicephalus microplus]
MFRNLIRFRPVDAVHRLLSLTASRLDIRTDQDYGAHAAEPGPVRSAFDETRRNAPDNRSGRNARYGR